MTGRELLFHALRGEPTERVPVWLLFPYHPCGFYADVKNLPAYAPVVERIERMGITLDRRGLGAALFTDDVAHGQEETTEDGVLVQRSWTEYKGKRIHSETRHKPAGVIRKQLVADEDALEFYLSLPILTDRKTIHARLRERMPRLQSEIDAFPIHLGATMLDLGEPINPLYHAADLEEFAIWSLEYEDEIGHWLDKAMEQKRILYAWCLENVAADVYFLVGSELAAPPLVSLQTFKRWIVPYARELIAMIRSSGKFAIQHFHGQVRSLLPDFLDMAPHALHTIEAPPVGNCTFSQAYDVVGDAITLIGNIQYDEFRALPPARMRAEVRKVLDEVDGRRFILSPTAGPFEHDTPPRLIENYLAFLDAAENYRR